MRVLYLSGFPLSLNPALFLNKHGFLQKVTMGSKLAPSKPALANISLLAQASLHRHTLCWYFHRVVNPLRECLSPALAPTHKLLTGRGWRRGLPGWTLCCLAQDLAGSRCVIMRFCAHCSFTVRKLVLALAAVAQ